MPGTFNYKFDTEAFKGETTINTGLYIGGKFVDPVEGGTTDVYNPSMFIASQYIHPLLTTAPSHWPGPDEDIYRYCQGCRPRREGRTKGV